MFIGRLTLREIQKEASQASTFVFEKSQATWLAGQHFMFIKQHFPFDFRGLTRVFTIVSAPEEDTLSFTTRYFDDTSSSFKRALFRMQPGDRLWAYGPSPIFDYFRALDADKEYVLLIGGIGITPVISILEYIVKKDLNTDVCLLYSNRSKDDIAFGQEIDIWSKGNPRIKVFYTITDQEPKDQRYYFGRIDKQFLMKNIPDFKERIFFIFGPPKMVSAMENICNEAGCNKEMIKAENFVGY